MHKTFGEILKTLMSERNVTTSMLAQSIGFSKKTIQEWLGPQGRVPRDLSAIKKLSEFFDCSTHFILFGEEDPRLQKNEAFSGAEVHTGTYEITIKKVSKEK